MSAFTLTSTTTTTHTDTLRHYGKLAGVGYSQDMEIDQDLPRQTDPMDPHLEPQNSNDQTQSATTEPDHGLPAKPPVAQDAPTAAGQEGLPEQAADIPGPMGKVTGSACACFTLTHSS